MMHHRRRQLNLADVIEVVSRLCQDDHEMSAVVADMINRKLIRVHVPHKQGKVVRRIH
jgi:hypothetical protein